MQEWGEVIFEEIVADYSQIEEKWILRFRKHLKSQKDQQK